MEKIKTLIKSYFEVYNEYLENEKDFPDEAKDDWAEFRLIEKKVLEFFGISQEKELNRGLYSFIENSCIEKRIEYSDVIANKIISTMEKLSQIEPFSKHMDALFNDLFNDFEKAPFQKRDELQSVSGIYVMYEKGKPIYVGRANNIKSRIQWHTRKSSGSESATFAFNLAKMEYGKIKEVKKKRKELMEIEEFLEIFEKHKVNISNLDFKCIEVPNDIIQTMFEPYLAYKLGTYPILNTFENH